jgi:hypothetical protein
MGAMGALIVRAAINDEVNEVSFARPSPIGHVQLTGISTQAPVTHLQHPRTSPYSSSCRMPLAIQSKNTNEVPYTP